MPGFVEYLRVISRRVKRFVLKIYRIITALITGMPSRILIGDSLLTSIPDHGQSRLPMSRTTKIFTHNCLVVQVSCKLAVLVAADFCD